MPPIAHAAGVGVGTLYRYFDNKQALVNAVYRDAKAHIQHTLLDGLDLQRPTRELFDTLWVRLTLFARGHPASFRFLEVQDHYSYLDCDSLAAEQTLLEPLTILVRAGQETGVLGRSMHPEIAIALFWGAFVGLFKAERLGYVELADDDLNTARDACWAAIAGA